MFKKEPYLQNIIAFHGPIDLNMVSLLANYAKSMIQADTSVKQKVFKIFIELVQNLSFYSAQKTNLIDVRHSGIGWVEVSDKTSHYSIRTGNMILKEHAPILQKNCEEINSLNVEQLRELKRQTRKKAAIKDIGAHIGLIQAAILSGNSLIPVIEPMDNIYSFFTLETTIDK